MLSVKNKVASLLVPSLQPSRRCYPPPIKLRLLCFFRGSRYYFFNLSILAKLPTTAVFDVLVQESVDPFAPCQLAYICYPTHRSRGYDVYRHCLSHHSSVVSGMVNFIPSPPPQQTRELNEIPLLGDTAITSRPPDDVRSRQ